MYLLFLSIAVLSIIVTFAFKYLSLLRWVSGHAYVLSKQRENFSILEMLDLFRNVKPFPISCQKGWKIDSYSHGHRVWFNFLTFPHNMNAPSIKVYAVFNLVPSTSQALLKVLKNVSHFCEWKPGVITAANAYSLASSEVIEGCLLSQPVQIDSVKEERLCHPTSKFGMGSQDRWFTENVATTVSTEYKRFWHKEDSSVCWLLQMDESLQTCEFYLIQPAQEMNQSLLSIVTWSRDHSESSIDKASVLLSSLIEYISLRHVQCTPFAAITLPQDMSNSVTETSISADGHESDTILSSRRHPEKQASNGSTGTDTFSWSRKNDLDKYSYILRYKYRKPPSSSASAGIPRSSTTTLTSDFLSSGDRPSSFIDPKGHAASKFGKGVQAAKAGIRRTVSDGITAKQSLTANQENEQRDALNLIDDDDDEETDEPRVHYLLQREDSVSEDMTVAHFKTLSNQCASELLAEATRASEINLELSPDQQAESSGGWIFSSFEKNIVVLKKVERLGTTIQRYMGKGFVMAPPKTVWEAVRNPHTKFMYDDTLKKVDIIATIDSIIKIVYFYHESQQLLVRESCDMCVLQGERKEGQRYILTYTSTEHDKCPVRPGITRAKVLPSGWIIEPARQDNRLYSLVTYIMQIDFGQHPENHGTLPFQDMITHYPFSIADLQQYLKPAVQMLRHKSVA